MRVSVIDAGQFGTAIAILAARTGHDVTLHVQPFNQEQKDLHWNMKYGAQKTNYLYLPKVVLPPMSFADNFAPAKSADVILIAVPSKFLWLAIENLKPYLMENPNCVLALLTKGLDAYGNIPIGVKLRNHLRLTIGFENFAIISGATPAKIMVEPHRTTVASIASTDLNIIKKLRKLFLNTGLATVGTTDIVGVGWGGALKNAYAVGYGILEGLNKRDLAWEFVNRLALMEMKLFLYRAGAHPKTLHSPAVKDDFRVTSTGYLNWESRNVSFGKFLAKYQPKHNAGNPKDPIDSYLKNHTVEGYEAISALWRIAQNERINAPLIHGIHSVCELGASPLSFLTHFKTAQNLGTDAPSL